MGHHKRSVLRRILAAGLLSLLVTASASADFTDTTNHWARDSIARWSEEYQIINGYSDGTFRPDDSITRGAFAGILNRLMHYYAKSSANVFSDIAGTYWEDDILRLHAAAVYTGSNGKAMPSETLTRQQAVSLIARAFDVYGDSISLPFDDADDIAGYAKGDITTMNDRGYLDGVVTNVFRPNDPITRAEIVRIFDNVVGILLTDTTPWSQDVQGNLVINSPSGANVENCSVSGELFIAAGVTGTVTLTNVDIAGRTVNFSRTRPVVVKTPDYVPPEPAASTDSGRTTSAATTSSARTTSAASTSAATTAPASTEAAATTAPAKTTSSGREITAAGSTENSVDTNSPARTTKSGRVITTAGSTEGGAEAAASTTAARTTASGRIITPAGQEAASTESAAPASTSQERIIPVDSDDFPAASTSAASTSSARTTSAASTSSARTTSPATTTAPAATTSGGTKSGATTSGGFSLPANTLAKPYPYAHNPAWASDVYTASPTTGRFFTYSGRTIPIYAKIQANQLGPGTFKWNGDRVRYTGSKYRVTFGIDVSSYQNNNRPSYGYKLNWTAAKNAGVEFAMVRVAYRGYGSTGVLSSDKYYKTNIQGAMAAGIMTGAYVFSTAKTVEEAIREADLVISNLKGLNINGPVAYDWEINGTNYRNAGVSKEMATACAIAFCERVKNAGYTPMVYISQYCGYVKYDMGALRTYLKWYPQYSAKSNSNPYPTFRYQVDLWQFSDSCSISGVGTKIDANVWFWPK